MQTIEIKPEVMAILCNKAEREGKAITDIVDELLRSLLSPGSVLRPISLKCHNCRHEIDYEINISQGYCDYCESVVFVDKE
jgi:hypothetical protein